MWHNSQKSIQIQKVHLMLMYKYKNRASREGSHSQVEPQSHKPAANTVQTRDL